MNKIILILILLSSALKGVSQQMFTQIPNRDYTKVFNSTELGNYYYFFSVQSYYINSTLMGGTYIHKTDLSGNVLDSLKLTDTLLPGVLRINNDDSLLCLYTIKVVRADSSFYHPEFRLGRMRYDQNFNLIDSFTTAIPLGSFKAGYYWYSQRDGQRLIYITRGLDTAIIGTNQTSERIIALDSNGNYLFDKTLFNFAHNYHDITTTNNGKNYIMRFGGTDTPSNYTGGMFRLLDSNFNFIKWAPEPSNYFPGFNGLDKYNETKFSMGFANTSSGSPFTDSFCVEIRDTNFALIKQTCIPRHTVLSNYSNMSNAFDTRWYDGKDINNIYIGNNWGGASNLLPNSYFTLSNLDSNLNIRWSKVFGGDYPYNIERYYSTSDGGCFVMGIRRLGNTPTDPREPVVFKISQTGVMTNITSFAPSADAFFTAYPNPSKGQYAIKNTSNQVYELLVFSQDGKVIYKQDDINTELFGFDISAFAKGTYLYKIFTSDGKSASGKLVKQ